MAELICPHCDAELEVDDDLGGSVCRCYHCEGLISVPEADALAEPEAGEVSAPGPGDGPEDGPEDAPADWPDPLAEGEAEAESTDEADEVDEVDEVDEIGEVDEVDEVGEVGEVDEADEVAEADDFAEAEDIAEGGDLAEVGDVAEAEDLAAVGEVEVSEVAGAAEADPAPEPPRKEARKQRRGVHRRRAPSSGPRRATMLALIFSVATLLGVLTLAVILVSQQIEAEETPEQIHADLFGEHTNPFLEAEANFLGVPLAGRTVLIVDSSAAMRAHLGVAHHAAAQAIEAADDRHALQVIAAREGNVMVFPPEPMSGGELSADAVERRLEGVSAGGGFVLAEAVERAVEAGPELLIIAARLLPELDEVDAMIRLADAADARLAVVLIDAEEADAVRLIEDAGGEAVHIPAMRLQEWYEEHRMAR